MKSLAPRNWLTFILFVIAALAAIYFYLVPLTTLAPISPGLIQLLRAVLLFLALILLFERIFAVKIYTKILLGLTLGAVAGLIFHVGIAEIKPIGTAFIRLIQMIVVPPALATSKKWGMSV